MITLYILNVLVAIVGYNSVNCAQRIVGGSDADIGEFPHQISLRMKDFHICGGSIISSQWVLTAAHCVDGMKSTDLYVVVGTNTLSSGGQRYDIEKIVIYSPYISPLIINDIALIKLNSTVVFSDKVKTINLPTEDTKPGQNLTLSGWGMTEFPAPANSSTIPDKLQKMQVHTIDNIRCFLEHKKFSLTPVPPILPTNICTFTKKGQGACKGDSGGPLIDGEHQVGVVSWGIPCAKGKPDVFTRVHSYLKWIKDHINQNGTDTSSLVATTEPTTTTGSSG